MLWHYETGRGSGRATKKGRAGRGWRQGGRGPERDQERERGRGKRKSRRRACFVQKNEVWRKCFVSFLNVTKKMQRRPPHVFMCFEESSQLLFTWVLFTSPSKCKLFINFPTTPLLGLGDQIQGNYRMKEEKKRLLFSRFAVDEVGEFCNIVPFAYLCNSIPL